MRNIVFLSMQFFYVYIHFIDSKLHFTSVCSMTTPNGRFMTQKKICLSMSDCKFYGVLFEIECFFLCASVLFCF